jgi:prevent-host-death family protein
MQSLSIAEAKSRFSELISRASAGERFVIRRRSRPLAVLINAVELDQIERQADAAQRLAMALGQDADLLAQIEEGKVHPAMAAFGLWKDDPDLASLVDEIYTNRQAQTARPVVML